MKADNGIDKIRRDCLLLFEQSIGYEFRVKGTLLTDICDGVNKIDQMVQGRKYGDFHIDLCELTGGKQDYSSYRNE